MNLLRPVVLTAFLFSGCAAQPGPVVVPREPSPPPPPPPSAVAPDKVPTTSNAPIRCSGDADVRVENRTVVVSGDGVIASAGCDIWIVNSTIRAGGWGIIITGAGDVYVEGSTVQGNLGAVSISNAGDLHAKSTKFIGARSITGAGEYNDKGGNQWSK